MSDLNRRRFLQALAGGSLALAGGACRSVDPGAPRNVLFIAIDDLNDWIQPLRGYRGKVFTPHLNRLAKAGMLFTNAHCSAPVCNPSRSSLMSGMSPASCGIVHNDENFRDVLPDVVTLPQYFARQGYATAAAGKVFHNRFPDVGSWQEYFEAPQQYRPPGRPLNGQMKWREFRQLPSEERMIDWGPVEVGAPTMPDSQIADWAIGYLEREITAPLFLGVGFLSPHLPWYIPQAFFDLYPESEILLPLVKQDDDADLGTVARRWISRDLLTKGELDLGGWKRMVRAYLAAISFADSQLGRLLDAWQASPHSNGGVVVLWSDHGFHMGEKFHFRKSTLWETATRVPLIVTAPGVEPGSRCDRPVSLLDLYPTVTDLANLPRREALEGESFAAQLRDPEAFRARPAFTEMLGRHFAVRSDRYRYIRYSNGDQELYDHKSDPQEWRNLIGEPEYEGIRREHKLWLNSPADARAKAESDHRKA